MRKDKTETRRGMGTLATALLTAFLVPAPAAHAVSATQNPYPLILPEPRIMQVKDASRIALITGRTAHAVLVANAAFPKAMLGAAEINREIVKLGFDPLDVVDEETAEKSSGKVLILLGNASQNKLTAGVFTDATARARNTIDEVQGYTIDFARDKRGRACIVVAGHDAQGTLYGAVTLFQMLERRGDALTVRRVFVKDWPDFKHRLCSKFNTGTRRRAGIQQHRDYIDWLLKHKINMMKGSLAFTDESTLRQAFSYARDRGISVLTSFLGDTGPLNAVGRIADLEKSGDLKDMRKSRRHKEFYVSYVRDDLLRQRAEADARRAAEMGLGWVYYHAIDTGSLGNYAEWRSRTDAARQRFGDDRAAADANCINIICDVYRRLAPGTQLFFAVIPYYTYVMADDFPRNIEPDIAEVYAKLYQKNVRTYFRDLARLTTTDIRISVREGSRKGVDDWIAGVPTSTHFYVLLGDGYYALAHTRPRYLRAYFREGRNDLIDVYGLVMRQQAVESIVLQLIAHEYMWNSERVGAADWPDVFFDYIHDVTEPAEIMDELVPRICDNIWGRDGGKYFYKLCQSKLVPGFIENPESFQRARGPRRSGTLADGAKAAITYRTANSDIFFPPMVAATMKQQMDALPGLVRELREWLVNHPGKDQDPYSYRHGTHYFKRATLWEVYSTLWYHLLGTDQAIKNGDRARALVLLDAGLAAAKTARDRLDEAHALAQKHQRLYNRYRALHELITVEQLGDRLRKKKEALDRLLGARKIDDKTKAAFKARTVTARKTDTAPSLDGDLADDCWKTAAWAKGFVVIDGTAESTDMRLPLEQSDCAVLYDDDYLYLGVVFHKEKDIDLVASVTQRDQGFGRDCCGEVFLMPTPERYYHFTFNPLGARYDAGWTPGRRKDAISTGPPWNSDWELKTRVHPDRWVAEIRIPLRDLAAAPESGARWKINIARQRYRESTTGAVPEYSALQVLQTGKRKGFHDYERFSRLEFTNGGAEGRK